MTIIRLALRQIAARPLQTGLNVFLLSLGIATIALLMLFNAQMQDRLNRAANGIDLVVGAKGSPLQLILSCIYHADIPNGNISLREARKVAGHPLVEQAIPIALGDNLAGFRIVGTERGFPTLYEGKLAQGRLWSVSMEAVLGANVARRTHLKLNDEFASNHGLSSGGALHDDNKYQVVGILQPSGTILDDLVLTDLQSVWDMHEDHGTTNTAMLNPGSLAKPDTAANDEEGKPREITALLIRYKTPLAVLALPRLINANTMMQAASPAMESARLFKLIGFGLDAFRAFAWVLIGSAALSVFVALYTTLQQRKADLAIMRMLGSSRLRLFGVVWLEGLLLAALSLLLGLALGHGTLEWVGRTGLASGLPLSGLAWLPEEAWLIALALGVGGVAALLPAIQAYRVDIATVLSEP